MSKKKKISVDRDFILTFVFWSLTWSLPFGLFPNACTCSPDLNSAVDLFIFL